MTVTWGFIVMSFASNWRTLRIRRKTLATIDQMHTHVTQMEESVDAMKDDYSSAIALISVMARGPELPGRVYREIADQFLKEHQIEAEVTLVDDNQTSKAVH